MAKLKKVILLQGREHKAAGLHWVLGLGCWVLGCEPQEPNKHPPRGILFLWGQEPNELNKAAGLPETRKLWLARLFDILEGNEIVTWSNTITDHSRKIQKAEKGKLPETVGRKAMDLFGSSQAAETKLEEDS